MLHKLYGSTTILLRTRGLIALVTIDKLYDIGLMVTFLAMAADYGQ